MQSAVGLLAPLKAILQLTIAKLTLYILAFTYSFGNPGSVILDPQSTEQPSVAVPLACVQQSVTDNFWQSRDAIVVLPFQVTEPLMVTTCVFKSLYL